MRMTCPQPAAASAPSFDDALMEAPVVQDTPQQQQQEVIADAHMRVPSIVFGPGRRRHSESRVSELKCFNLDNHQQVVVTQETNIFDALASACASASTS